MSDGVTIHGCAAHSNMQRFQRLKCTHFAKNHAKWRRKTRTFGINHAKNPRIQLAVNSNQMVAAYGEILIIIW